MSCPSPQVPVLLGGRAHYPAPAPSIPIGPAPLPSQHSSPRTAAPSSWFYTLLTLHTTNLPGKRPWAVPRSWCSTKGQDGLGWKTLTEHLVPLYRQGN